MDNLTATDYKKMAGRKRRKSYIKYTKYLKKLWKELQKGCPCPAVPKNKDREFVDDDEKVVYFDRQWRGRRSKELKKQYNRSFRNTNPEELYKNCDYKRKSGDFRWDYS